MSTAAANWPALSDAARRALADVAVLLSEGFSGRLVLDCHQGGVRGIKQETSIQGSDLGKLAAAKGLAASGS